MEIYRERLPLHPLLGRHVLLDSRSRGYAVQPSNVTVRSVRHVAHIGILDQGQVGSCTGNAGVSALYHEPHYAQASVPWPRYTADETGALNLYTDATQTDPFPGEYPGEDTGSDGLTVCKVVKAAGDISGYRAALDLDSSLQALMSGPGITGVPWYQSMFDTDSSGLMTVDVRSGLAGGHELCVDEIVAADDPHNGTGQLLVGGPNSWSASWGCSGRWYMTRRQLVDAAAAGRRRLLLGAGHRARPDTAGRPRRRPVGRDEGLVGAAARQRERARGEGGEGVGQGEGAVIGWGAAGGAAARSLSAALHHDANVARRTQKARILP